MDLIDQVERLGFSPTRLKRVRPLVQFYVDQGTIAGAVVLLARHGKIACCENAGQADREAGLAMRRDAIFRIYSMTKPVVSAAVMMLVEDNCFRLTDPIAAFLPEFRRMQVVREARAGTLLLEDANRPITIYDLLTHTAGLTYGFDPTPLDDQVRKKFWTQIMKQPDLPARDMASAVAKLPLAYQPGTTFYYSLAFDVLGSLIEVVTGQSLGQILRSRIFEPLGMVDTDFYVPADKVERFTTDYAPDRSGKLCVYDARLESSYLCPGRTQAGGSALVSTIEDYWRFCQMLLNRGELDGARLLGPKTVEYMRLNHLPGGGRVPNQPGKGFGFGFAVVADPTVTREMLSPGSFGWGARPAPISG